MHDGKTGAAGSGRGPTAAAPMRDGAALGRVLARLDGRGYASYKQLAGQWRLGALRLAVDHVMEGKDFDKTLDLTKIKPYGVV